LNDIGKVGNEIYALCTRVANNPLARSSKYHQFFSF